MNQNEGVFKACTAVQLNIRKKKDLKPGYFIIIQIILITRVTRTVYLKMCSLLDQGTLKHLSCDTGQSRQLG